MNYSQALEFLNNSFTSFQTAGRKAYREGLEGITAMCREMDDPQRNYLTTHIAGTNGKGSVAHILASVLQSAGYCVGLFTSPHMNDFRERIRVDGQPITQKAVTHFVRQYGDRMVELGLSYFEMTTAMAFGYFSDADVEVAIIETGLGGRLDATNIIRPALSVITNVGPDHTDILGDTIEEIAAEKAGIIKCGIPVLIGESDGTTDDIFMARARELGARISFADKLWECVERSPHENTVRYALQRRADGRTQYIDLDLLGEYQQKNLITARAALTILKKETHLSISTRALQTGCRTVMESTGLRGRWQVISDSPLTVADTGHNIHAIRLLLEQLSRQEHRRIYMVIGFSADKDISEILAMLPSDARYIFTQAASPRALPAEKLYAQASEHGLSGSISASVGDALALARELAGPDDMIFIGGSSYVVAEIL